LNFLLGDVEHMSNVVPHGTIDYLVDIESSFFYPDKTAFLREVREVLRDDGVFFYGSLIQSRRVPELEALLFKYFEVQKEEDITQNILQSLHFDTDAVSQYLDNTFPWCKCLPTL
jgi:hypothetical protein